MGPVRIDLHTHSNASDGTEPPAEVMRRARLAGLDVVALTDHDTVAGHDEARRHLPAGLTLVPGMELSCHAGGRSLHLLAYLFDPAHAGLAAERARIQHDRVRRARAMVDKLAALGAPVTWDHVTVIARDGVVGRPHIARAMAEAGVISEPAEAFTADWIGEGGRAYEEKYSLDPELAIGLVGAAGGVSVLAHPRTKGYEVPDEVIVRLAAAGLAGVEVWHPEQPESERDRVLVLARELGLAATGGSDDHGALTGYRIGSESTPPQSFEQLTERASGAVPARG
jgi:3',5'-nucleoside bisphosphate phosphatase